MSILSPTFITRVAMVTSLCMGDGEWPCGEEELVAVVCAVDVVDMVDVLLGAGDLGTDEPKEKGGWGGDVNNRVFR